MNHLAEAIQNTRASSFSASDVAFLRMIRFSIGGSRPPISDWPAWAVFSACRRNSDCTIESRALTNNSKERSNVADVLLSDDPSGGVMGIVSGRLALDVCDERRRLCSRKIAMAEVNTLQIKVRKIGPISIFCKRISESIENLQIDDLCRTGSPSSREDCRQ